LLVLDGRAEVNFHFLEERAVGTVFLQLGRRLVELPHDHHIPQGGVSLGPLLVLGAFHNRSVNRRAHRLNQDPILVGRIGCFTLDVAQFHKRRHFELLLEKKCGRRSDCREQK
jgi:hypothetical protein